MAKKSWIAFILFASIPVISVVYLFSIAETSIGWAGFPSWLWGFIFIEMLYCAFMFYFIKNVWK